MKKFFILFFIFLNLYSSNLAVYDSSYGKLYITDGIRHSISSWTSGFCSDGKCYFGNYYYNVYNIISWDCITNAQLLESSNNLYLYSFSYNSTCPVVCPPTTYNYNNECVTVCPSGNIYFGYDGQNYCVSANINDLSNVLGDSISQCSFTTIDGSLKIITINGKDFVGINCGSDLFLLPYATTDMALSDLDSNLTTPQQITCPDGQDIVIDTNGTVTCVSDSDTTNTDTTDTDTYTDTNDTDTYTDTNDTNTYTDTNNSNTYTDTNDTNITNNYDCCYYYNNPSASIGTTWEQNNNYWCNIQLNCCISVTADGQCLDVTTSDTNSTLSFGDLNQTNQLLTNINDTLNKKLFELNKTYSQFNSLLDNINNGDLPEALINLKNNIGIDTQKYSPLNTYSDDKFPTISVTLFGKQIILLDDSYRQFIPFDIIRPMVIFGFVFSAFLFCIRTD